MHASIPKQARSIGCSFAFCLFVGASSAFADPLVAGGGAIYRIGTAATFQEGCFPPCMCPIMEQRPVVGTMKLVYAGNIDGIETYAVQDVNWRVEGANGPIPIRGEGVYRIGSPHPIGVIEHRIELGLSVGTDPPQHFDSGWHTFSDPSGTFRLSVSINGMYCWDRVIEIDAHRVPESQIRPYVLDQGSTYQYGCFWSCDCASQPGRPMIGEFALVPLSVNSLFEEFAIVNVRWLALSADANAGTPLNGYGFYRKGGEFAVQHQMGLDLIVGDAPRHHFDSGWVVGGGEFPMIDIDMEYNPNNCVGERLHVIAKPRDGETCGGFAGIACEDPNEFCKLPTGHCCCDHFGVCTPRANACPTVHDPVCGCDGVTYGNECEADAAGVSVDHYGPCRAHCGNPDDPPCPEGAFCKYPTGSCGDPTNVGGLCTEIPNTGCPDVWDPVCGCDGVTYSNECDADAAGVSIAHRGPCEDPCQPTPDGAGCTSCLSAIPEDVCRASALYLDAATGAITTLDCDCMDMSACHIEFGDASPFAVGNCPEGQACEVVAHDSNNDGIDDTFSARCAGSPVGACCFDIDDGPVPYDTCQPMEEATCTENGGMFGGFNTACSNVQACCLPGIGGDGLCVQLNPFCCLASGGIPQGPGSNCEPSLIFCHGFTGQMCPDGLSCVDIPDNCDPNSGAADCPGVCVLDPAAPFCGGIGGPHCPAGHICVDLPADDCDPATGGADCFGACVAERSPCREVCGGIMGLGCDDPGEFCKLPIGHCCCDQFGACTPIPQGCPEIWDPVCGCDGVTYGNACEADAAQVSIDHEGECSTNPCSAMRVLTFPDATYCPHNLKRVRILLSPPSSASAIAIEDSPPAGWTVGSVSAGGSYDAANHKVKWGPFFPPFPSQVWYDTMPANDTAGAKCFAGIIAIDGDIAQEICGDQCLDPCCPPMLADSSQPPCSGCNIGGCNSCANSSCFDGNVSLCEVIGYACSWLHGCNDDIAGVTRAAYMWRNGECYCFDDVAGNWYPTACGDPACCDNTGPRAGLASADGGAWASLEPVSNSRTGRGGSLLVSIQVSPPTGTLASAGELSLPKGWKVIDMGGEGLHDAQHAKIKWGPFYDQASRVLTVELRPPLVRSQEKPGRLVPLDGAEGLTGVVSFDGVNHPVQFVK